ncbi:unnamed protein product [Merluccius merluccius]
MGACGVFRGLAFDVQQVQVLHHRETSSLILYQKYRVCSRATVCSTPKCPPTCPSCICLMMSGRKSISKDFNSYGVLLSISPVAVGY